MGETVRWAQNCLRIFKLSKSVNGKESIQAQSTCHMASATEGGGKRASTFGIPAGTNRNGKQPDPFSKSLRTPKARLHEGMPSCQPIRQHQFGFANLEKRHAEKMREQSMQQVLQILTEVNYY